MFKIVMVLCYLIRAKNTFEEKDEAEEHGYLDPIIFLYTQCPLLGYRDFKILAVVQETHNGGIDLHNLHSFY